MKNFDELWTTHLQPVLARGEAARRKTRLQSVLARWGGLALALVVGTIVGLVSDSLVFGVMLGLLCLIVVTQFGVKDESWS